MHCSHDLHPTTYQVEHMGDWLGLATKLMQKAENLSTWCFYGNVGAGKTTLIKALCTYLEVRQVVTSPTFNLVHDYTTSKQQNVYHFDFYRCTGTEEAIEIGFESYLTERDYVFIEWPQIVEPLLPSLYVEITMGSTSLYRRIITAQIRKRKNL